MAYLEYEKQKTKARLAKLRSEKGWSLQQLSEQLEKKSVIVSHTNLKNYEIQDERHNLYHRTGSMSLEYFVALADIYDVSVDYLLGRSDTKKAEYNRISEELQLDDEAIDLLKEIIKEDKIEDAAHGYYGQRIRLINSLLLIPDFLIVLDFLRKACNAHEINKVYDRPNVAEKKMDDDKLEEAEKYIARYGMKAVDAFVIRNLYFTEIMSRLDGIIRNFPENILREYFEKLAADDI
jgi:transcriptional regulator with XRE-family HTH domain